MHMTTTRTTGGNNLAMMLGGIFMSVPLMLVLLYAMAGENADMRGTALTFLGVALAAQYLWYYPTVKEYSRANKSDGLVWLHFQRFALSNGLLAGIVLAIGLGIVTGHFTSMTIPFVLLLAGMTVSVLGYRPWVRVE